MATAAACPSPPTVGVNVVMGCYSPIREVDGADGGEVPAKSDRIRVISANVKGEPDRVMSPVRRALPEFRATNTTTPAGASGGGEAEAALLRWFWKKQTLAAIKACKVVASVSFIPRDPTADQTLYVRRDVGVDAGVALFELHRVTQTFRKPFEAYPSSRVPPAELEVSEPYYFLLSPELIDTAIPELFDRETRRQLREVLTCFYHDLETVELTLSLLHGGDEYLLTWAKGTLST